MKKITLYFLTLLTILGTNQKLLSQEKPITLTSTRNEDKTVDIFYEKNTPGSYYLKLEFTRLENCNAYYIFDAVVKNSYGNLLTLRPINNQQHVNFSYTYTTIMGEPNPKVDSLFVYTIPLNEGKKTKIYEASNLGEKYFGNEKPKNWKSYVIYRTSPDTICSMRKGVVVKITDKYESDSSIQKEYTSKTNSITIEHADGTYAYYAGFKKNSLFVDIGQTVYPQTKLGILDIFNATKYRLSFAIYYLYDGNLDIHKKRNFKNRKSLNAFLTPYFITENGIEKINSKNEYITTSNEEVLLKEFTKKESKKYKKTPQFVE